MYGWVLECELGACALSGRRVVWCVKTVNVNVKEVNKDIACPGPQSPWEPRGGLANLTLIAAEGEK